MAQSANRRPSFPKEWWAARTRRERTHGVLLVLITGLAIAHQAWLWNWYVEDAAISFAFARHAAEGEGLVAYAGGERVEGYSNPTWVGLLAFLGLFGANPFAAAKWVQVVLCALTVPLTYLAAQAAVRRDESNVPLVAALALALSSQFAIWGACGLENALFCFLMALGLWRTSVELGSGGTPWSALVWFALAISRPEALMYAAIAGFFTMVFQWHAGRGLRPTIAWLALFWIPYLGYHGARFAYFAWELPNTFYAKIGEHREPKPMNWQGHGWMYVRNWARTMGQGWWLPVYLLAMAGTDKRRVLAALTLTTGLAIAVLLPADQRILLPLLLGFALICYLALVDTQPRRNRLMAAAAGAVLTGGFIAFAEYQRHRGADSTLTSPTWLPDITAWLFGATAVCWPWVDWGQRGAQLRAMCWTMMVGGLLFAVSVHGDWMNGWRWMSLVSVPMAILFAVGAESAARIVTTYCEPSRPGLWVAAGTAVLALAPAPPNYTFTEGFVAKPVTGPYSVRARVNYKNRVKDRLHHYGPLVDLDVDQGAHLWWATDHRMLDIAGLVDVPLARHKFDATFLKQYLLQEHRPLFAHLHGGWASSSGITRMPEFKRDYFEIPGYPAGDKYHIGNWIRRDALFTQTWTGPLSAPVRIGTNHMLHGWSVPSPEVSADRRLYLELGISVDRPTPGRAFRILAFLSDSTGEHLATWDLPPGYDWLRQDRWRPGEVFHGRFSPQLPAGLPPGTYDLGFVVLNADNEVVPAYPEYDPADPATTPLPDKAVLGGVGPWPARVARGEIRFVGAVTVVPIPEMEAASEADLAAARRHASEGRCKQAEHAWFLSRAHRPKAQPFFERVGPTIHTDIARCWALKAEQTPEMAHGALVQARDWDRTQPDLLRLTPTVTQQLIDQGDRATESEKWEVAFHAYNDALMLQPNRSWVRRRAEKARERWLDIGEPLPNRPANKSRAKAKAKAIGPKAPPRRGLPGGTPPANGEPGQ